ncbi:GMC family oxidoreductase [Sphingobium baderi]|uniref:Choline dehydrogenase n=1 Tax=Sphingobium baderi TaxID=1332080 RepID=A0A0S3F2G9_9SPHN|nr:GMC family oxidoreductase N-terminal domain-containing protein [Sphingobium baderi]ALR21843.1 choline dehydrogenase [Sphingobium baderi]
MEVFDHVIVGGGTAAGILAWRLTEAGRSICVLEAGPSDSKFYHRVPAGFIKTLFDPDVTWQLASTPNPHSGDRPIQYTQGKVLGGSSSVNGMVYNRGQRADFDHWAQLGNRGWGYDDILPYFRRTERREGEGDDAYRGREGRLGVSTSPWPSAVVDAFIDSAAERGHPYNPDYNGARQEGVGRYQSAIAGGRRASTATAFLHPARRMGAVVRTHALATRILMEGKRASGVAYRQHGETKEVMARRSVILAAGTTNTPKLLQLSGIGPAALLQRHGIPVLHALPGVGENFHDHYSPRLVVRLREGVDSLNAHVRGLPLVGQVLRWMSGRPSILALSPALVHVFGRSDPAFDMTDYSLVFTPGSYKQGFIGRLDDFPGMTCGAWQMRPESRGHVRIASADPMDVPLLDPDYLGVEKDRAVLIAALREARAILSAAPLAPMIEGELFPGPDVQSDDEWLDFARQYGNSSYHLVGTAKMGPASDPMTVVDDRLRVHGLDGLRVVDASIIPVIPSANTYAATMMIAEKASDMILSDA